MCVGSQPGSASERFCTTETSSLAGRRSAIPGWEAGRGPSSSLQMFGLGRSTPMPQPEEGVLPRRCTAGSCQAWQRDGAKSRQA